MRTRRVAGWAAGLFAIVALVAATRSATAGPSGGAPPAVGTIYYADLPTEVMWGMDGSGGSRVMTGISTPSPIGTYRASRLLHGGARWFLHLEGVPGEAGPGGGSRSDLFLVREDGAVRMRLTSDPTVKLRYECDWASDEDANGATIGVVAARWTGTTSTDTVVADTCGLHVARLLFDAAGVPLGLEAQPAFATPLPVKTGTPGRETADLYSWFAWSPDRTQIVFNRSTDISRLWKVDAASGALAIVGEGVAPDWSPDGSRIACHRLIPGKKEKTAIETVRPDGSDRLTVYSINRYMTSWKDQYLQFPQWSPDGAYLAYEYNVIDRMGGLKSTRWIYRIRTDGTGNTNLTPEVAAGTGWVGAWLRDWR